MTVQEKHGVSRQGLDATFRKREAHKSNLILEANLLKTQGHYREAADRFAKAAEIEERLSDALFQKGLVDKYYVHRFSALSCWAQAGDIHHAIVLGEELLARPDLPSRLRQRIEEYLELLQIRRARWFAEFAPDVVSMTA